MEKVKRSGERVEEEWFGFFRGIVAIGERGCWGVAVEKKGNEGG